MGFDRPTTTAILIKSTCYNHLYSIYLVRECDFMVGDNKWNIKQATNQPTNPPSRARYCMVRHGKPRQTTKLASKHFYFMAFDDIGGTYLFPCHASSSQMRTI